MSTVQELSSGLEDDYDFSSLRVFVFGGSTPRKDEMRKMQDSLPTLQIITQCMYCI